MTVNFKEYRNKKKPEEAKARKRYEERIDEFESLDVDSILTGAIMKATGQNVVQGIDYTLQKDKMIEQANKYSEIASEIAGMVTE